MRGITRHVAATFDRFDALLRQSRTGDLTSPFDIDDLSADNLRAVAEFRGHPETALVDAVERFVAAIDRLDEPMAHQFGPISVGLQQLAFGLNELVLHHHDVCDAVGYPWRPPREVTATLVQVWQRALGGLPDATDDWLRLLAASGRGCARLSRR